VTAVPWRPRRRAAQGDTAGPRETHDLTAFGGGPALALAGGVNVSRAALRVSFLLLGLTLVACNGESATGGAGGGGGSNGNGNDGWSGQTRVESILEKSCAGCHGTQFSSCWNVQDDASEIEGAVASGAMPRSGELAASDKAALLHWLRDGAHCSGKRPEGSGSGGGSIGSGSPPIAY
jgi:hypothetical protein